MHDEKAFTSRLTALALLRVLSLSSPVLLICTLLSVGSSSPEASYQGCAVCTGSTYQHRACRGNYDAVCMHIVFPLLNEAAKFARALEESSHRQLPVTRRKKKGRVDSSSNVFLENLHSAKNLVTVYYVTDVNQLTDFVWFRDSGIRVNVGLQGINLMPIYEDVSHQSDNSFMLQTPNSDQKAKHFSNILDRHCRNPLPSYYNVTLEIYRDRTTKAVVKECSPTSRSLRNCQFEPGIRSYYLHRSVSEPCPIAIGKTEAMKPAANSIVCTDGNDLLHLLFKMDASVVHPVRLSSSICSESFSKCNQCLELSQCRLVNDDDQHCCHGDCLHLPECKLYFGSSCSKAQIECATGDAFRYTLTPVFLHLETQFRCHIRQKRPDILYRLWFYLTIPVGGSIIETPKKSSEILYSNAEDFVHGTNEIDFLTVEHWAGAPLASDLILVGSNLNEDYVNYTVKTQSHLHHRRHHHHHVSDIRPEWIQSNVFTFSAQFRDPFTYSTSTWVNNHNCDKDVRAFLPVSSSAEDAEEEQPVTVVTRATESTFQYAVVSPESDPHLRVSLCGNASILSWWFQENPSIVIFDETYVASLSLANDKKTWTVHTAGKLSRCPGYFKVTVNDYSEREEVARYDALVSCPVNFTISFQFPNHGMKKDKTYELILNDLSAEHIVFLSRLGHSDDPDFNLSTDRDKRHSFDNLTKEVKFWDSSRTSTAIVLVVILVLFCILLDLLCSMSSIVSCWHNKPRCDLRQPLSFTQVTVCCSVATGVAYKAVFCPYFVMRLLYLILFTCTTVSLLLGFIQWERLQKMRQSTADDMLGSAEIPRIAMSRELKVNGVLKEHMLKKFDIQQACNSYLKEIFANLTSAQRDVTLNNTRHDFSSDENSLSLLFENFAQSKQESIYNKTKSVFRPVLQALNQKVHHVISYFCNQLAVTFRSPWFSHVRSLSKTSQSQLSNALPERLIQKTNHFEGLAEVARLLEIAEFEDLVMFKSTFSKQLDMFYESKLLSLNYSKSIRAFPCHWQRIPLFNSFTDLQGLDSTRYFAPEPGAILRNSNTADSKSIDDREEYHAAIRHRTYYVSSNGSRLEFSAKSAASWNDEDSFYQMLSFKLLHLMLFVDILLLVYRLTNLCLEMMHQGQGSVGFVCDAFESLPKETKIIKKREKCVSFADLGKCPNDLTKNFHSMQDLRRKSSPTTSAVDVSDYINESRQGNSSYAILLTLSHNIHGTIKRVSPHTLVTLNSLTILYRSVGYSSDRCHPDFPFLSKHCFAYVQLFWTLLRCSDAFPRIVLASVVLLMLGLTLNVVSQNVVPEFLLSFLELCSSDFTLNGYFDNVANGSNEELTRWKSRFMMFEVKQLQGIFQFFNTGYNAQRRFYRDYVCSLRKQFNLPLGVCVKHSSAPMKSFPTSVLPCNFIHLEPLSVHEEELQSLQGKILGRLLQQFSTINGLVMSICIVLGLFIIGSFIFQVIISTFSVLKLQDFVPVRTFVTTKNQNLMQSSRPGHAKNTSNNKTEMQTSKRCREKANAPNDNSVSTSCSLVNVSSVSSSTNINSAANFKKFLETKV